MDYSVVMITRPCSTLTFTRCSARSLPAIAWRASSTGKDGASISYVGTDDNIEEFVVFANRKESGFAVVRVLGKNMTPNNIMTLMSVLKESKIDMEQLKPLQQLVK